LLALIMAGGKGTRLNMGEKPLVTICGKPMIAYVIDSFEQAGCEIIVVASSDTPMTKNWCRTQGIEIFNAMGRGYVEDIIETVCVLEEKKPLFTCVSDLPCLTPDIIRYILTAYCDSAKDACSTWVPYAICQQFKCDPRHIERIDGEEVCPAGINILKGEGITEEQEECRVIIQDPRLVFNINTKEELSLVQSHLCRGNIH
jgi:adenosylcobinamide-phosphate guanylyltransferase